MAQVPLEMFLGRDFPVSILCPEFLTWENWLNE